MGKAKKVTAVPGQGIPAVVDPNPARSASDEAEVKAEETANAEKAAEKQVNEQAHQEAVQADIEAQQQAQKAKEAQANEAFENLEERPALVTQLMDQHGVDELFENSKGEYFLEKHLAVNSEGGTQGRVKTHIR
ncbi:hypothetical protein [Pelobium manganitolerans]|uniref:hypothetical protein n=1 Tax=Pelobium manganitolerans TaxID=1842495 RepID=UPI003FA3BAFE